MPKPDEPVWVVEPSSGKIGTVPYGQLASARQSGYSVATNEQVAAHEEAKAAKKAATEGFVNKVNTVVESVARAATLGGADYLAAKFTPEVTESVAARKDTTLGKGAELAADVALVLGTGGTAGALKAGAVGAKLAAKEGAALASEAILSQAAKTATKAALHRTPVGLAAEGAAKLRGAVEGGAKAMLGESRLAQTAAKTAGYAAEGGALGGMAQIADNVSEASLGNEELTAERLLANVGSGTLLGAGLGGALPVAAALGKGAARASGNALAAAATSRPVELAADLLPGSLGKAAKTVNTLGKVAQGDGTILSRLGKAAGDEKFFGPGSVRSDYVRRDELLDEIAAELAPKLDRAAAIQGARRVATETASDISQIAQQVKRGPEVWANAQGELAGLARDLQGMAALRGMRIGTGAAIKRTVRDIAEAASATGDEAGLFVALDEARAKFARIAKSESRVAADNAGAVAARIDGLLQDENIWGNAARMQKERLAAAVDADENRVLSSLVRSGKADVGRLRSHLARAAPGDDFSKTLIAELEREATALQKTIDSGPTVERMKATESLAELRSIQGTIAQSLGRIGDANDLHRAVLQEGRNGISGGAFSGAMLSGMVGGPVAAAASLAVSALSSPATLASRIGTIENLARQVQASELAMSSTVDRIVRFGRETKDAAGVLVTRAPAVAATVGARENAEATRKNVERKLKTLQRAAENPELIIAQAQRLTGGMTEAAPGVTTAVIGKYANAIRHLQAVSPVVPQAGGVQSNARTAPEIPDSAILSMQRRIDAATDPKSVLQQLENGEIHPDALQTARAVWPEQMSDINHRIISRLTADRAPAGYQHLLRLSAVTGAPLAATMSPKFIKAQQAMHEERAAQKAKMQQQGAPPPKRAPETAKTVANSSEQLVANLQGGRR